MPPFVQNAIDKVGNFWTKRTLPQRILIAGLALSVIIAFGMMLYWMNRPDYKVLLSKMYPEDASRVVKMLQAQKVDYKLEENGTTILVPTEQVYDLRLKVAGEGQVHGQGLGFEIFDEIKIGQTDFTQRINYQRALQGELARTISEFQEIDKVRVHLVIPHKSLFIEEQAKPSASIVLKMKGQQKLDQKQLQGIINLVAMSVEGMDKGRVTISDVSGKILHQPAAEGSLEGLTTTQAEYRQNMERGLETRIEQMLSPIIGHGRVIAKVNANVDFSQKTIRKEMYNPDSAVVRSEQRSEESNKGQNNMAGGAPDANFRGDSITGSQATQDSTRETRTTNYEINKEEQQIVVPVGELLRLTVAVIVDGTYSPDQSGKPVFVPRNDQEIERIKQLVTNAVGFDGKRGDAIEVSCISFGTPEEYGDPSLLQNMMEYSQRLGRPFLNGILVFLFLIMVVRPVIMALIRPRVAEEEVVELAGLPEGEERLSLAEADVEDEAMEAQRRLENAKVLALQLSDQDMDSAVSVLRTWLKQPQET